MAAAHTHATAAMRARGACERLRMRELEDARGKRGVSFAYYNVTHQSIVATKHHHHVVRVFVIQGHARVHISVHGDGG